MPSPHMATNGKNFLIHCCTVVIDAALSLPGGSLREGQNEERTQTMEQHKLLNSNQAIQCPTEKGYLPGSGGARALR